MKVSNIPLEERIEQLFEIVKDCKGCFRFCSVNRFHTSSTYCHTGIEPRLLEHKIIPDSLFIKNGNIAKIYFQHCNLRCVFCYDYDKHHNLANQNFNKVTLEEYSSILFDDFSNEKIKGIHLVNVDHLIPHTLYSLAKVLQRTKTINKPIIFESNGFAYAPTVKFLKDCIDIYYTDFKFISEQYAFKYLKEQDYPEIVKETIVEMYSQVGDCQIKNNYITKGLVIKILILPDLTDEYIQILNFLKNISTKIGIVLLANYRPSGLVPERSIYQSINKFTTKEEIDTIYTIAKNLGFSNLFVIH